MSTVTNHEFSCALYKAVATGNNGNVFVSPFSIAAAMAMVYIGAEGDSSKELGSAMKWNNPSKELVAAEYKDAVAMLLSSSGSLKLANKVWVQANMNVKAQFLDILRTSFLSDVGQADFKTRSTAVREEINKWVEEKTSNLIKDLVKDGVVNSQTRLFLVNAIYFKALWEDKFDKENTHDSDFHLANGKAVKVNMMFRNGKIPFLFDSERKCTVVELAYKGRQHAMTLVMPDEDQSLETLEKQLSSTALLKWSKEMKKSASIDVFIPRFKVGFESQLVEAFKKLGVTQLFDDRADLSGITDDGGLYVSDIVHKAFIDVNEEGTEAAAATGVGMMLMSMPPQINFNRPFLFTIRDVASGNVIFMGRITDPRQE